LIKQRRVFDFGEARIAYTLFKSKKLRSKESRSKGRRSAESSGSTVKAPRRIVLLHGAGVAGELTWTFIANYLKHWDEILVPDLLGMGESYYDSADQLSFSIQDICHSLFALLRHHNWTKIDLVGYSLGGLVALELNSEAIKELDKQSHPDVEVNHLCLIEPALFSDQSLQAALVFRQAFVPLAANIQAEPDNDQHFLDFLDLVSPHRQRSEQMDKLAIQRLQTRPLGFAKALGAVSQYADQLDEHNLQQLIRSIPKGLGIIGGLSNPGLLLAQKKIQQQQSDWHIETLAKVDHSLVYVRPKRIAELINLHLE
jgi:pimeloyl-ACP methyl ester carboxylesterase